MILFALVSLLLLRFSISLYFKSRLNWGITELIQFAWSCIRSLSQKYFWIKHVFGNHTESMKIHGEIFKCCTWLMFGHIKENIAILNQLEKRWGQVESTLRKCVSWNNLNVQPCGINLKFELDEVYKMQTRNFAIQRL